MNRRQQRELFASERPVRSDYARELSYARRRVITVCVVLAFLSGSLWYAFWGRSESNPADIPTIKAEGAYKQKPAEPGGIDIPNQDVRVYEELEGKGLPRVEHLMPPPEAPKEVQKPADAVAIPDAAATAPAPVSAPVATATPAATPQADVLNNVSAAKPVQTTVEKAPQKASAVVASKPPAAPKAEGDSLDDLIKRINTKEQSTASSATEKSVIQLASLPGEAQARELLGTLQKKYAGELGNAKLHLARADLGSKGIFYRIQSDSLAKDEANRICSSLKRLNAGCILVGK